MRILLILFLFLSSFCLQAQSDAERYLSRFDSLAMEVSGKYEIPASVVLGIALLESAAGTSRLCRINHNHFGMKVRVKSSKTRSGYTTTFRKFESDEAAYLYFGEMVSGKKYYSGLKGNTDYLTWLKAMKAAKYATTSSWVIHVDKMIKRYDLTCYDKTVPDKAMYLTAETDTIPFQKK